MGAIADAKGLGQRSRAFGSSNARVFAFSTALALIGYQVYQLTLAARAPIDRPFELSVWVLGGLFFVAELCVVHINLRRQVFSASLTEIPLVLGLYFADPAALIVAYVVGAGLALIVHRRQQPVKLYFNLCHLGLQAVFATTVFHAVLGGADPVTSRGWLAVLVATLVTDVLAGTVIAVVMTLAEGRLVMPTDLIGVGSVASFANSALGLTAATILWVRLDAAWLLTFPAVLLLLAYRAYADQHDKHESLERLYGSTRELQSSLGQESIGGTLLEQAREMLRAEIAELILFPIEDEPRGQLITLGPGDGSTTEPFALEVTQGVWARVASEGQGLLFQRPIRNEKVRDYFSSRGIKDAIIAPVGGEGQIAGTLMVANRSDDVGTFDHADLKMLETLAAHASMWLEKGRLMESLRDQAAANEYLAQHDPLTGLYNRSYFTELVRGAIERAKRSDGLLAVLLMDLDRFKEINDTLGHRVGDQVLEELSRRLRSVLPEDASLARAGGDEFVILLPNIHEAALATGQAEQIIELFKTPIQLDDAVLDVQASIGVALYPIHARDVDGLLQRADVAMYLAKEAHSGYETYGAERDRYSPSRLALVGELRRAIEAEELVVFYQPKISLETGAAQGVEALVRWDHPRKGLIPPNEFIPLAEHTGLIKPLTLFVLRRALMDLRRWRETEPDLHVAVNLSVRSLVDGDICSQIAAILDECDAPRGALELEITESSIMDDPVRSIGVLAKLSAMGISLAIDDFGTGYSSLSYLKRLPVDSLKVDKSFVLGMEADENDAIIVRSIIDLGRNLGLRVVAEGVEAAEVATALKSMGCEAAQGFGFSRPLPAEKLGPWLIAHASLRGTSGAPFLQIASTA